MSKKIPYLIFASCILFILSHHTVNAQATDLFISEYVEGSGNVKYLEIFNGTGSAVNLDDYEVLLFSNGSSSASSNSLTSISGTLAHGAVLVIANASAEVVYNGEKLLSNVTFFNGDDALAIRKKSTNSYVDIFGRIGEDPGSAWTSGDLTTANKTLRRKSNVSSGITTNPSNGFPSLATEWEVFNQDDITGLGAHTFDVAQHIGETTFDFDNTFTPLNQIDPLNWTASSKTIENGLEIFRFLAQEGGSDLNDQDELATEFTGFTVLIPGAENVATLGVFLNDNLVGTINNPETTASIALTNATLQDNTLGVFSIKVLLQDVVNDKEQIGIHIVRVSVNESGSGFVEQSGEYTLENPQTSTQNVIEVVATDMVNTTIGNQFAVKSTFIISVHAVNALGSIDTDETAQVSLQVRNGSSDLVFQQGSESNIGFESGLATWSVSYPTIETVTLTVNSYLGSLDFEVQIVENSAGGLYETIAPGLLGSELITYLRSNYQVKNDLGYNGARDRIFMELDNQRVNGTGASVNTLECVYTGRVITEFTSRTDAQNMNFNTEHTWPQGLFNKQNPMVSDIHHLFPTDAAVNNARGNYPFEELEANEVTTWYRGSEQTSSAPAANVQGEYSQLKSGTSFEPRDVHKGNVARAIYYFWTIYGGRSNVTDDASFFEGMKNDLLIWHRFDLSDEAEIRRSLKTAELQGNINPFVHDTSLVARAYFPETIVSNEQEILTALPNNFELHQNYPNPFNPSTCISYTLGFHTMVKLEVFDQLGRKVSTLVNTVQSAGQHSVFFNAQNLSSGMYLVKLEYSGGSMIKKMTLLK